MKYERLYKIVSITAVGPTRAEITLASVGGPAYSGVDCVVGFGTLKFTMPMAEAKRYQIDNLYWLRLGA